MDSQYTRLHEFRQLMDYEVVKNLRHGIKKSDFLMASLIWKEQLRLIEAEIRRRQKTYQRLNA